MFINAVDTGYMLNNNCLTITATSTSTISKVMMMTTTKAATAITTATTSPQMQYEIYRHSNNDWMVPLL